MPAAPLAWAQGLVALVLVGTVMLGLYRIWRGPGLGDRMLVAQLFGTTGVAVLVVLSELQQMPALRDVALVLALLGVLSTVAFVARVWRADAGNPADAGGPE